MMAGVTHTPAIIKLSVRHACTASGASFHPSAVRTQAARLSSQARVCAPNADARRAPRAPALRPHRPDRPTHAPPRHHRVVCGLHQITPLIRAQDGRISQARAPDAEAEAVERAIEARIFASCWRRGRSERPEPSCVSCAAPSAHSLTRRGGGCAPAGASPLPPRRLRTPSASQSLFTPAATLHRVPLSVCRAHRCCDIGGGGSFPASLRRPPLQRGGGGFMRRNGLGRDMGAAPSAGVPVVHLAVPTPTTPCFTTCYST
ncbi:hypothetical protein DFH06DRAFT_284153 [Mycena polygramma]|nr:hypothetical protein DFH06DRAFT_284153 [Mycena polygramma]